MNLSRQNITRMIDQAAQIGVNRALSKMRTQQPAPANKTKAKGPTGAAVGIPIGAMLKYQVVVNDHVTRVYWTDGRITMREKPVEGLRIVED